MQYYLNLIAKIAGGKKKRFLFQDYSIIRLA